ncbi:MAG: hypothetical protein ABIJ10_05065 [Candidatus Micrarchaeota archaeon]|nr:hypothetical protein [Candidatus Micrarchaeota archaeon]
MYPQSKQLFSQDKVVLIAPNTSARALIHIVSTSSRRTASGSIIPFENFRNAFLHIEGIRRDVSSWYKKETGEEMNTYELGDLFNTVRARFRNHENFRRALSLLCINRNDADKIVIPWWNEIAASEVRCDISPDLESQSIALEPRHSYETQLVRSGVDIPGISSISVYGVILTSDNQLILTLRAGVSYPNTYHLPAGALGLTDDMINQRESIYDFFLREELQREVGIQLTDVNSAHFIARIFDPTIDKGSGYVFLVRTGLTATEVGECYASNKDLDKGEHSKLIPIHATNEAILSFIRAHYKGAVENRRDRSDDEQYLLHPGALCLVAFMRQNPDVLSSYYLDGSW